LLLCQFNWAFSSIHTYQEKCNCKGEEKIVLCALIKHWCIYHYHKYKIEYIELRVIKIILTWIIIKKIINIILKIDPLF